MNNDKSKQPCDGFDLNKPSKVKAFLVAPIAALTGWLILIYLIAKR